MNKISKWVVIGLIILCLIILFGAYIGPCDFRWGKCIGGDSIVVTRTFVHFAISLLVISPFLFFVRDAVFLKWLRFSIAWFVVAAVLIALAPVSTGGWMSFGPTKELVSIWMGGLFVAISLIKLVLDSKKF